MEETQQRVVAGRYRLDAPLGSGGMGTVWRAHDLVLGRAVAVKEVTFPHGLSDSDRQVLHERTRREARAAARLDHPSAVTVFDVVEDGDAPYLVMELVEAQTLAEVVRDGGPLSPQRTAEIGVQLLGALEAAHAQGIVHRDVKPSNVLVREDGRVVLTDFGIATATGDSTITHTGMLLGSPAYIAPERARGHTPGPASDLWSLGATLFSVVEGKPPYDRGEPLLTVSAVVTGEHEPFVHAGQLAPVLEGLLDKDPDQRLDLDEARRRLQQVARTRPSAAPGTAVLTAPVAAPAADGTAAIPLPEVREQAPAPRVARPVRRRPAAPQRRGRLLPAAVAAALVLLAGGIGLALTPGDDPDGRTNQDATSTAPEPSPPDPEQQEESEPAAPPAEDEEPAEQQGGEGPSVSSGWSTDTGGAGWTVALPPGYSSTGGGEYVQGGTGRTLRVTTGEGQPDAVADRERQAEDFERRHPSYEEIRIDPVDYRGYEAADWEFTYEGLHVINRVFVVDGVGHSLFFQTAEGDFDGARSDFDGIAKAFRPVGT